MVRQQISKKIKECCKVPDGYFCILLEVRLSQQVSAKTIPVQELSIQKELKKKRSVVNENPTKGTHVLNPFPYPMEKKPKLKGRYKSFVTFLEKLYHESENTEDEKTYSRAYLDPTSYGPENGYLVFDQICPDNIEPCDILKYTADAVYLYHVKEEFGQHTRDACSQIINSAKMIRSALSTHQPQNYLQKLWEKATTLRKDPSEWLKSAKSQLDGLGEKKFLNIFRNRKVVFVYAHLPAANKSLVDESKTKSCLAPEDLRSTEPAKLFAHLIESGYLDSHGRLTGKFHSIKKEKFKLTGGFESESEAVFKQLRAFRSISKSTLAKIELLQLAQNLRALNFEFRIVEIPRSNEVVPTIDSSQLSGTVPQDFDLSDPDDEMGDSQLWMTTGSLQTPTKVSKIENGPIGYHNVGNACYMIASLQALFNIPSFCKHVTDKKNDTELTKALDSVLQEKEPDNTGPLIKGLRQCVFKTASPEIFTGENRETAQHDAHEFIQFLLSELQWPTFQTKTAFTTTMGTRHSANEEHHFLSLPLVGKTFQEIIDAYFKAEELEDKKNPYQGKFKGKTYTFDNWKQQYKMVSFPDFLFVQLKRFDNEMKKNKMRIEFPANGIADVAGQKYEIIGVVNHIGDTAHSGHYTADIKNLRDSTKEQWVRCNDKDLKEDNPINPSSTAYIIVLRKR